jgi:hypothetical protein
VFPAPPPSSATVGLDSVLPHDSLDRFAVTLSRFCDSPGAVAPMLAEDVLDLRLHLPVALLFP